MSQTAKPGHPRRPWPEEKIQRLRYLVSRGLTGPDICYTLEDEFGGVCTEEALRSRIREYGLHTPGSTSTRPPPWPDAKLQRLAELAAEKLTRREIGRRLRTEFGTSHSTDTIKVKLRQIGVSAPAAKPAMATKPTVHVSQPNRVRDFSVLKKPPGLRDLSVLK